VRQTVCISFYTHSHIGQCHTARYVCVAINMPRCGLESENQNTLKQFKKLPVQHSAGGTGCGARRRKIDCTADLSFLATKM
jgi:hypothetical protein